MLKMIIYLLFFFFLLLCAVTLSEDPKIGGKRNYSKPDFCLYCKKQYNSKISKHYFATHSKEERVQHILELPVGSKERKRQLKILQYEGNHLHSCEVCFDTITKIIHLKVEV